MHVQKVHIKNILTRTGGYLQDIATHSLQPYQGCTFGNSLCGVGCYVQHNPFITKGREWGSFLEVRENGPESYLRNAPRERRFAHKNGRRFSIFMSSSTDPFLPQETKYGITERLLQGMMDEPPDLLIVQTHSHMVETQGEIFERLARKTKLRIHISIESDRDRLPGLPPPASKVEKRLEAATRLKQRGLWTVITVAPLLPIENPAKFFQACSEASHALVLDHFIGGDGSPQGRRTLKTSLPEAMEKLEPDSTRESYLEKMLQEAQNHYKGPIGVGRDGFGGRYLT